MLHPPSPEPTDLDDARWARLARGLGATVDPGGWLDVEVDGRMFVLLRASLGASTLVVAHTVVAADVSAADAATTAGSWPIGAVVLSGDRWLARHTFVGVPGPDAATDVLRCLLLQARSLEPRASRDTAAFSHYAL